MGLVYAEVELINTEDMTLARKHYIGEEEIKRMNVTMLVDTGAYMLAINESIQEQLQFPFMEKRKFELGNGRYEEFDIVSSVELRFKNRRTICDALVLPGNTEPLLGAIPMEGMDVIIDPARRELLVNPEHPYYAVMKLK